MTDLSSIVSQGAVDLVDSGSTPGATVIITDTDATVASAAHGVRRQGTPTPLTLTDMVHIGSCTKAMTATVIARAVDAGALTWDEPVQTWIDGQVHPARANVTIVDLLAHRAGVAPYEEEDQVDTLPPLPDDPVAQRQQLSSLVMAARPEVPVGEKAVYSNAGFAVAASVCERATGIPWEEAVVATCRDLGVAVDLGWPGAGGEPGPWGHKMNGDAFEAQNPDDGYQLSGWIAPAGNVRMSTIEMAIWARANLAGISGSTNLLQLDSWQMIHSLHGEAGLGWGIREIGGQTASAHSGSAGTFFTIIVLLHQAQLGIAINTNSDPELSNDPVVALLKQMIAALLS